MRPDATEGQKRFNNKFDSKAFNPCTKALQYVAVFLVLFLRKKGSFKFRTGLRTCNILRSVDQHSPVEKHVNFIQTFLVFTRTVTFPSK